MTNSSAVTENCVLFDECQRKRYRRSRYCSRHTNWKTKTGHYEGLPVPPRERDNWYIHKGYRYKRIDNKNVAEHRWIMEQILGRVLLPEENVHHINGDRADNRPENLELWNTRQPSGQRVEDKLAWAYHIINLYG